MGEVRGRDATILENNIVRPRAQQESLAFGPVTMPAILIWI
jgi:hypothetical protein